MDLNNLEKRIERMAIETKKTRDVLTNNNVPLSVIDYYNGKIDAYKEISQYIKVD